MLTELPSQIESNEDLGRYITSNKVVKKNRVPMRNFRDDYKDKSVDRTSHFTKEKAAEIARENTKCFYGWAILIADDVKKNGRDLEYDPTPKNPLHTKIILPDDSEETQENHARQLADLACVRKAPPEKPHPNSA